ncbi:hypothetical protein SBW85_07510 [Vibrio plantisponsor]|jgi:hypothetical protein|uniref:Uncharacterized protein n=1 Tax=Vibrio plantisponsor TaxID=664643 RepID=A0ABU4IGE2_9VIBR|nr:hypothetical protein [Vibrio plantisponsor]EKO3963143.1 hypothetical protein [Vibrio fluvialis]MDW6017623.1 hypothetical protein [Vibrio plantisponsor]NNM40458.1 hypothetical protein [Vibrio plantisponsor]
MFSIESSVKQQCAESVVRGDVINLLGHEFWVVEKCEAQGPNMIVKCVGEDPLSISKDRVVSVRSYR